MLRRWLAAALLAVLLFVLVACGGADEAGPDAGLIDAHAGLCLAAARPSEARAVFFDRSHDALHEVARRLDGVDRPLAARLLEAKERVESGLQPPREGLTGDLRRLADVYRAALGRLAIAAAPCD